MNDDVVRLIASEALRERAPATRSLRRALRLGVPIAPVQHAGRLRRRASRRARAEYFRAHRFSASRRRAVRGRAVRLLARRRSRCGGRPRRRRSTDAAECAGRRAAAGGRQPPARRVHGPCWPACGRWSSAVAAVGPEIGSLLAELGAEVVKIESQAQPRPAARGHASSPTRRTAPSRSTTRRGPAQRLPRSAPGARAAISPCELCARADVVIENNRGGVVAHWGLDYEDVRRVRPDVVYLSSQGYRGGGPLGEAPALRPAERAPSRAPRGCGTIADAPYPGGLVAQPSRPHRQQARHRCRARRARASPPHGRGQLIDMAQTRGRGFSARRGAISSGLHGPPRRAATATPSITPFRTGSIRAPATIAGARSPWSATTPGNASAPRRLAATRRVGDARRTAAGARRDRPARRRVDELAQRRRGRGGAAGGRHLGDRRARRRRSARRCPSAVARRDRHRRAPRDRPRAPHCHAAAHEPHDADAGAAGAAARRRHRGGARPSGWGSMGTRCSA